MSRKNPSVGNQHGNSRNSQLHMHMTEREKKYQLWAEMMKRKEEASKPKKTTKAKTSYMDKWYKGTSHQNAKSITALYLAASNKKVHWSTVKDNYDLSLTTLCRYRHWYNNGKFDGDIDRINKHVFKNKNKLIEDITKSPSPTIVEIKRLYDLALPNNYDRFTQSVRVRASRGKKKDIEMYDHMLNDEQKVELMDLANLELSEVKPITKSDVVTGVIVGAVVGASMAAYAFLTNGAL